MTKHVVWLCAWLMFCAALAFLVREALTPAPVVVEGIR